MTEGAVRQNSSFHPRSLARLEPSGVRTALAAVVPLILGQVLGYPGFGLFVGIAGLYLSVSDKQGSTVRTLIAGLFINAAAMSGGTLAGNYAALSVVLLFVLAFAGGMMSAFGEVAGQIGFVMTLTFAVALGQAGNAAAAGERFAAFVIGGTFSLVLTAVLWHFHRATSSALDD